MARELSVDVPRGFGSAAFARNLVHASFDQELSTEQLDDLLVIVSELTTNAVLYGVGEIRLRVSVEGERVFGEVIDQGSGFAQAVHDQGSGDVGNRGLLIVAALAERWGIHDGSSHVWFELALDGRRAHADPQLGTDERPPQLDA